MAGIPLYVHVPYCRRICPYCDFNVHVARPIPEADDLAAYRAELDHWASRAPWQGQPVSSVYLGGGTPSLLSPATLDDLLAHVARRFGVTHDAEITIEANPGTLGIDALRALRRSGVTRLSLGAQSFDPSVLRTLGRDHAPEDTPAAVSAARTAGLPNVSIDLIYGVPGQTVAGWVADLDAAIALEPDQVSAYALTYEPGTPMTRRRASGALVPVDEDAEAAMEDELLARLSAAGYERYEIASHARPGFACRHNQRYWDGSGYLGIGPGAHSFAPDPLPGRRWANVRPPALYRERMRTGHTAVDHEDMLTLERARADFVVTGLRRVIGVDADAFARRFGGPLETAFPQVAALVADDLLTRDGPRLRLTARGLRFADSVAAAFV